MHDGAMALLWQRKPGFKRLLGYALFVLVAGYLLLKFTHYENVIPGQFPMPEHGHHDAGATDRPRSIDDDGIAARSVTEAPGPDSGQKPDSKNAAEERPRAQSEPKPKAAGNGALCNADTVCSTGEMYFNLTAGVDKMQPDVCINDVMILDPRKLVKGMSVVVLDEVKKSVHDIKYFDFTKNDREFHGFMLYVPDSRVVFFATYGDISEKISAASREILAKFGSRVAESLKAGQTFVMVGQKGLEQGQAVEKSGFISPRNAEAYTFVSGCLKIPMGKLTQVSLLDGARAGVPAGGGKDINTGQVIREVLYGNELAHCGLKDRCPPGSISASVYSGQNKDDEPKICVNGRFIMARDLNQAGRGLNIVVLNATSADVLRVGHFDTYAQDSSALEIFLEEMIPGEMIIVVSFDEASTKLSAMAKQMFFELGSGLIQNLKFRASWYFIGQKGITGFSPFEELNYAPKDGGWATPVNRKMCVAYKLDGKAVRSDPPPRTKNTAKRHFCIKYDGYEDFCDEENLDDPLKPAPLFNKSMEGNPIFNVPIVILAGLSHNSLRLCLETVLLQPGINVANVLVMYDSNYEESRALSQLFGVKAAAVNASTKYGDQVKKSLQQAWTYFPNAKEIIILEEDLLLTVDFLFYMAQLLPILQADPTLFSVSAWNENGFEPVSCLNDLAYRVEGFPGLAFMLTKATYEKYMQNNLEQCCNRRAWEGWLVDVAERQMVVPDVSRVYRRHSEGLGIVPRAIEDLLHRPRAYNKDRNAVIFNPKSLASDAYDESLRSVISRSNLLSTTGFASCGSPGIDNPFNIPSSSTRSSYVLYFLQQKTDGTDETLKQLCKCFGLYHSAEAPARGVYKHVLRFSFRGQQIQLVGSSSSFYSLKPATATPVSVR